MKKEYETYWNELSSREQLLYDLLFTGITAALGGDEERASRIIDNAWKSADRLEPDNSKK